MFSLAANRLWSSIDFGEIINEEKCREEFKKTDIYNRFPSDKLKIAEDSLCNKRRRITNQ